MASPLLMAASALFGAGAFISFGEARRARAGRVQGGNLGEDRVGQALDEANGMDRIGPILVQSRPDRTAMIDHIVRGRSRLLVVETKNWTGVISGGSRDRRWLQVRPSGEEQAQRNPIMQAKRQAKILQEATGVPVASLVVMAGRSQPADGRFPQGVVTLDGIAAVLPGLLDGEHHTGSATPADIERAWSRLVQLDQAVDAQKQLDRHVEEAAARYGKREWIGWVAMAIAAAGVAWSELAIF